MARRKRSTPRSLEPRLSLKVLRQTRMPNNFTRTQHITSMELYSHLIHSKRRQRQSSIDHHQRLKSQRKMRKQMPR